MQLPTQQDDDFIAEWNLRKSSAQGLDILSTTFGSELMPVLLPQVGSVEVRGAWVGSDASGSHSLNVYHLSFAGATELEQP